MDPPKPPRLTRPTMKKSSVDLQNEITENLHFLQRQVEVHYGHRATFRPDATVQFLAKIVGLTRQLREQWTRYVEIDATIREEFPAKLPNRPQTEEGEKDGEVRKEDVAQQPSGQRERPAKGEEPKKPNRSDNATSTETGTKPKDHRRASSNVLENDRAEDSQRPRQRNMWSQRTTTTIFDGGRKPQKLNRHAQQMSASYIQEQPHRTRQPPTIVYDGS